MEIKHYKKGQIVTLNGKRYRLTRNLDLRVPIAKSACPLCLSTRKVKNKCSTLKLL